MEKFTRRRETLRRGGMEKSIGAAASGGGVHPSSGKPEEQMTEATSGCFKS